MWTFDNVLLGFVLWLFVGVMCTWMVLNIYYVCFGFRGSAQRIRAFINALLAHNRLRLYTPPGSYNSESSSEQGALTSSASAKAAVKVWEICTICLDNLNNVDLVRKLPCAHKFHAICIDLWMEREAVCPICKVWEIGDVGMLGRICHPGITPGYELV